MVVSRKSIILLLLAAGFAGCSGTSTPAIKPADSRPRIYASNDPLLFLVEALAGDAADTICPLPEGAAAKSWAPDGEAVVGFQEADLIVLNGAGYEQWTETISLPDSKVLVTSESFADRLVPLDKSLTHSHGPGDVIAKAKFAATCWLDPQLAQLQASAIRDRLKQEFPRLAEQVDEEFSALTEKLNSLDQRLSTTMKRLSAQPLAFALPRFQYWEARFKLNAETLPGDGRLDDPVSVAALEFLRDDKGIDILIATSDLSEAAREQLSASGWKICVIDLAEAPGAGDYLSRMASNCERLEQLADSLDDKQP